ncbi:hypothetical protein KR215_000656, partial [Drosophila sulfurigaster]
WRKPVEALNKIAGKQHVPWYFASGFILFWCLLFFGIVIPYFYWLPTALTLEDEGKNLFIAERAYRNLYNLSNIGIKISGTDKNEVEAVNFLLSELGKIQDNLQNELFDMEIDRSQASGSFLVNSALRVYQGVQNIAVKISPKNSTSETFLLINSHFDSESGPGAGDAGSMIVTMMEVLRVIATSKQPIQHPIVFLFNGAEEGGLQASHGFITTHRWAPFCKAVINLDAAGSGGRDVLFQSGPNHPWLLKYYKRYIKHPFATTMAEEIFQAGIIPSDTDFRQFKTYGQIPGLDMAQCINGFVYHTKYDTINVIPRESLQNTGDNILGLVRGLANATELKNTEAHKDGHAVFFDFLGVYFIHYSEATGKYINIGVAGTIFILIMVSMWRMANVSHVTYSYIILWFILLLGIQISSFVLALTFPILISYVMDSFGLSLTYYSTPLLVFGLYVCPSLIGLTVPLTIFFSLQRNDKLSNHYHLQLALHGQAVILALVTVCLTLLDIRSTYIFVIPLGFYAVSLVLNLMTTLHDLGYAWIVLLKTSQIIPFLYSSYVFYILTVVLIPMGGRTGTSSNPDIIIAALAALGTVLSLGFLVPLINTFRRPSLVIFALLAVTALSVLLASSTQLGFPYRPKTNGQRIAYLEVRNKFYDYDGQLTKDESGYLMMFDDRRREQPLLDSNVNLSGMVSLKSRCEKHMMCGMPLNNNRCLVHSECSWIPRSEPVEPPQPTTLELIRLTVIDATTLRFEFNLTGPINMRLFIKPEEDVTINNWSFLKTYLDNPPSADRPYQIYFKYAFDRSPLHFFIELSVKRREPMYNHSSQKLNTGFDVPLFQIGVSAQYITDEGDDQSKEFASTFPSFSNLEHWPAFYQRYIY